MYLLDTMMLDWLATGSSRLGRKTKSLVETASPQSLLVSVVSIWEVGLLLQRNRLRLDPQITLALFRNELLSRGVVEELLTGPIVLAADGLTDFHQDPGDRFIVATALVTGATLITSDRKILAWPGRLARLDAET